jgi:hypothetical protein
MGSLYEMTVFILGVFTLIWRNEEKKLIELLMDDDDYDTTLAIDIT